MPSVRCSNSQSHEVRTAAWSDIAAQLETFQTGGGWIGPNELLLTAGRT